MRGAVKPGFPGIHRPAAARGRRLAAAAPIADQTEGAGRLKPTVDLVFHESAVLADPDAPGLHAEARDDGTAVDEGAEAGLGAARQKTHGAAASGLDDGVV